MPLRLLGSRTIVIVAVCAAAASAMRGGPINLVTNSGFETGDFTGWTNTFWNIDSGGNSGSFSAGDLCNNNAPCALSQNLSTVNAQSYTFSFWYLNADTTATNVFAVSWGGSVVFSFLDQPVHGWQQVTLTEIASSTTTAIQFSGGALGSGLFLDDVCVTAGSCVASSVPEPSALPLTGIALGLAAVCRKRRKS